MFLQDTNVIRSFRGTAWMCHSFSNNILRIYLSSYTFDKNPETM